jgi:hypothetical protein
VKGTSALEAATDALPATTRTRVMASARTNLAFIRDSFLA